jgi:hypothetical protein
MITMIIVLVILGLCLYLLETYVPMSPPIQIVIRVVVILFCTLWLLKTFGIVDVPIGTLR